MSIDEKYLNSLLKNLDKLNFNGNYSLASNIYLFEEISSTMDAASKKVELPNAVPYLFKVVEKPSFELLEIFLSRYQTAGRGRKSRVWNSKKDAGLYLTYLFRLNSQQNLAGLSLVVGLAVSKTLDYFSIPHCLKWPNDVLSEDFKKLSGILVEVKSRGSNIEEVIIGVGLNILSQNFPEDIPGISMQDLSKAQLDNAFIFSLLTLNIIETANKFFKEGFLKFFQEYNSKLGIIGKEIEFFEAENKQHAEVLGINEEGGLIVRISASQEEKVIYDPDYILKYTL